MIYKKLGKTSIDVSTLGFGLMRLKGFENSDPTYNKREEKNAINIIRTAYESGINFFDTAYCYGNGNNEYIVGKAIKKFRRNVLISTKSPCWLIENKSDFKCFLTKQLQRLNTNYIDFYFFHDVFQTVWKNNILKYSIIDEALKAKKEGIIRFLGLSSHDEPEFIKEILTSGVFDALICQYNLLDRRYEPAMKYASENDIGVIVMGPLGGGKLVWPSEFFSNILSGRSFNPQEIALRFVLENPDVNCTLSGMNTLKILSENVAIASKFKVINKVDLLWIEKKLKEAEKQSVFKCTECKYCLPCPKGINIPYIFRILKYHNIYKMIDYAKYEFSKLDSGGKRGPKPDICIECKNCENKCPQKIEIVKELKTSIHELG